MPGFDKTGPDGDGAMTGRKNGVCTGNVTDDQGTGYGRGGRRRRGGKGRRGACLRLSGSRRSNASRPGNAGKE